ncbi:MAG: substrate-binding domain-containing protein [Bacteroidales bacterium]|nr:substrate-binding domain-containing protein [Bacteroidales bacterium]
MKRYIPLAFLFTISLTGILHAQKSTYTIGFSQCVREDFWRETMEREMEIEVSLYPELELIKRDAGGNSLQQIEDVKELLKMGIDLLIISPNESAPLTPVVEEVFGKGIPVVVIDRQISSDAWTAFIGADNYEIGFQAGQYAASILAGTGSILEIAGLKGSSPAMARHNGFVDAIEAFPDVRIDHFLTGEWNWAEGKQVMDSALSEGIRPDLVFSHNDFMAAGAYEASLKHGVADDFFFIGIDGMAEGGIQYVIDGKLDATWLYPTGGDKAIDVARRILLKLPYDRVNNLQTLLIDQRNANTLKLQNQQLLSLQQKIAQQRDIAGSYREQISNLRVGAMVISAFTILVILLILLVIRAYRGKQKANKVLEAQNIEIEKQNEKLQRISEQLEIATQQKLRFFTNISHEFRTPLTLMTGPLESLLQQHDLVDEKRHQLEMIYRNALRLLRLINQIMDFRKLENDKMVLHAGQYDMVKFLMRIKENFDPLAEKKRIHFTLECSVDSQELWFDPDKMDKVMFNLLSNAFKFTHEGGMITIGFGTRDKEIGNEKKQVAEITVTDDGRGMSEEHIKNIFERFYQIEQQREGNYFPGTGLGLSLSKGLIELHSGTIDVSSSKGEGTVFYVCLPLGDAYLKEEEKVLVTDPDHFDLESFQLISEELGYFTELSDPEVSTQAVSTSSTKREYLILIVEDNPDLLNYMREILATNYEVLTAKDGKEAWETVQRDLPDIVVSDVMMPFMDGLELTQHIKGDMRTCHIPVIMLTAKTSIENKLEGLEAGADSYIPKPFNERHLLVRVRKLLEMRKVLGDHFREYLSFEAIENPVGHMDQRFLERTSRSISDHLQDLEFGVEELSREIGMSRVHLYRKIKQITGMSVSEYIRSVKLMHAKGLIRKREMSISEVAYASGFANPSYFTKCFRDQFDQSPSDYLAQFGNE